MKKFVIVLLIIVVLVGATVMGYPYLQAGISPSGITSPPSILHPLPLAFNAPFSDVVGNFSSMSMVETILTPPVNITDVTISYTVLSNNSSGVVLNITYSSPSIPTTSVIVNFSQNETVLNPQVISNNTIAVEGLELWFSLAAKLSPAAGLNSTTMPIVTTAREMIGPTLMVVSTYSSNTTFSLGSGTTMTSATIEVGSSVSNPNIVIPVGVFIRLQSNGQPLYLSLKIVSLTKGG